MPLIDTDDVKRIATEYANSVIATCPDCRHDEAVCLRHNDEFWDRLKYGEAIFKMCLQVPNLDWIPGDSAFFEDEQTVWGYCPQLGKETWPSTAGDVRKTVELFPENNYFMARRTVQSPPKAPRLN